MKKILLTCAGGAATNNVIRSLRDGGSKDHLIGISSSPSDLLLADVEERYPIPKATDPRFLEKLRVLLERCRPSLLHPQHDFEVRLISREREAIQGSGVRLFLPDPQVIEDCVDKFRSYVIWKAQGVPVAETLLVENPTGLQKAFDRFQGKLWLRAVEGVAGAGSLPVTDPSQFEFARMWIDRFQGWGGFTASELLGKDAVTFMGIWFQGELVVGQAKRRLKLSFGDRTLSGVTGVTGVMKTISDELSTRTALDAVAAMDPRPHGIFSVDMTCDFSGRPRVTEINCGRFFTTSYFFTKAGLNLPQIYRDIILEDRFPSLTRKLNPLPDDLVWIRGMDVEPLLTTLPKLEALEKSFGDGPAA